MIPEAQAALDALMAGNERFRACQPQNYVYPQDHLFNLSQKQQPMAAIIACSDSRVSPDVVFDQPLGTIFASRVPGNVASDSAKWMLEIAVLEFKVPLVIVMAHTGCLAVGQLLGGDSGGSGGMLRFDVMSAIYEAKSRHPEDLFREAVIQNAKQTVRKLESDNFAVAKVIREGRLNIVSALYEMETGRVLLV